ncbi:MAG: ribosome-associated translation inhibitor RaiA [Chloroflexota bacterium]
MPRGHRTVETVDVQVKGNHFPVTANMRDHVVRKMQRLHKYLDRLSAIEVELCEEATRDANHHNHVEATARVAGRTIRVEAMHGDMYAAVDEAVDKLYRQLNRQKERMKSHSSTKLSEITADSGEVIPPGDDDDDAITSASAEDVPVVRVERLDMKPQFEDEAIDELQSSGEHFYVFLNAANEQLNVLYRRDDGSLGLIQPRL